MMLAVVTSSADPELALYKSRPGTAIVVPAHLSQPGWVYEVGHGAHARLVTSIGDVFADDISGVLVRTQRAWPSELPHIDLEDRDYVAAEMTAFLAALLNELPCPLFNRSVANSLWGPSWTMQHWWRAATAEGFAVCPDDENLCTDRVELVALEGKVIRSDGTLPQDAAMLVLRLAKRAGVGLIGASFCKRHQALQHVTLRPDLNEELLQVIERRCATAKSPR